MNVPAGRAATSEQKSAVLASVLLQWDAGTSELRLGQLVYNAVAYDLRLRRKPAAERDIAYALFYTEDEILVKMVERFAADHQPPTESATSS